MPDQEEKLTSRICASLGLQNVEGDNSPGDLEDIILSRIYLFQLNPLTTGILDTQMIFLSQSRKEVMPENKR